MCTGPCLTGTSSSLQAPGRRWPARQTAAARPTAPHVSERPPAPASLPACKPARLAAAQHPMLQYSCLHAALHCCSLHPPQQASPAPFPPPPPPCSTHSGAGARRVRRRLIPRFPAGGSGLLRGSATVGEGSPLHGGSSMGQQELRRRRCASVPQCLSAPPDGLASLCTLSSVTGAPPSPWPCPLALHSCPASPASAACSGACCGSRGSA